ncbi:YrzI family small protein [Neobacillus sp. CF12]|nr:YrzI family small protein [Neobacillus sp. CF12]MDM5329582.1 YrzI family small protein [Neobacillus sp. CF12]
MNVNILFFTISIKKRDVSLEEAIHREMVEKSMQENKERYIHFIGRY